MTGTRPDIVSVTLILLLTILFISASPKANSRELSIGFTYDIPPYIIDNASKGIEIDIVRKALEYKGHIFKPEQFSYSELDFVVTKNGLDGAATVQGKRDGTYYSDNYIAFRNYAFTKKESKLNINNISDLKGRSIVAWQGAYKELGPQFESFFSPNTDHPKTKYREIANQSKQVEMFWNNEADVIVIDEYIMIWFTRHLPKSIGSVDDLVYHIIFGEKTQFRVSFKDKAIRDDFNEGLKFLHSNGIYKKILNKYLQ